MPVSSSEVRLRSAFNKLSPLAQLQVSLDEAISGDEKKFTYCVKYAATIHEKIASGNGSDNDHFALSVIMGRINTYLSSSANPNALLEGQHTLSMAIGFPALLKALLTHGADPNFHNISYIPPLHATAQRLSLYRSVLAPPLLTCAEMLAAKGADVTQYSTDGCTPIDHIIDYAFPADGENSFLTIRNLFEQVTTSPRNFDDIPFEAIDPSADETLPLTEQDRLAIQSYRTLELSIISSQAIALRAIEQRNQDILNPTPTPHHRTSRYDVLRSPPPSPASLDYLTRHLNSVIILETNTNTYRPNLYNEILYRLAIESDYEPELVLASSLPNPSTPIYQYDIDDCFSTTTTKPEPPKLNKIQHDILEATLDYIFDDISSALPPSKVIRLLSSFISSGAYPLSYKTTKKQLVELAVWDSFKQLRKLLNHPAPQNRNVGDGNAFNAKVLKGRDPINEAETEGCRTGVYENNVYYFKSGFGSEVLTEPQGLLGLSARNDNTAPPATKRAVRHAIKALIQREILKHQTQVATKIQFWYKRTRDENKALGMIKHPEQSLLANKIRQRRR